jgi:hypothetical protein
VNGRIILKWILEKWRGVSEFNNLAHASGKRRAVLNTAMKLPIQWEISWLDEKLGASPSASQEGLWSVQWRTLWTSLKSVWWAKIKLVQVQYSSNKAGCTTNSEWRKKSKRQKYKAKMPTGNHPVAFCNLSYLCLPKEWQYLICHIPAVSVKLV